jgi:hypothetical protein
VWRILLGLLPLWILLIQAIAFPGSIDPVMANPPEVVGLPAGVILIAGALALMALGAQVDAGQVARWLHGPRFRTV